MTRPHEDLEIGVFRDDQSALRSCLAGWDLCKCARPGFWDPWEGHYAEVARQMVVRGDWISLYWPGAPGENMFWSKPVFTFWIEALAFLVRVGLREPALVTGPQALLAQRVVRRDLLPVDTGEVQEERGEETGAVLPAGAMDDDASFGSIGDGSDG